VNVKTKNNTFLAPNGFWYRKVGKGQYVALQDWTYHSDRYGKDIKIVEGQMRDGATGAMDIESFAWWAHDQLCADGVWADGSDVTPMQAAQVLSDILKEEGRWIRAQTWKYTTLLFGCHKARKDLGGKS
jgi:hypothetical protein